MFGIITFIFLCFSGITKNLEFIQGVLTFASVGLIIVTTIFAILCNSNIPSELQNNPKYKDDGTTGWVKLTCDLQQYMHRLLNTIILALIALIFPNSYKDTVSLPVISRYVEHKFPFSLDTVLWYSDIALWYLNIVLWYYFYAVYFFLCCIHAV
ncbi:hypothetical protein Bcsk_002030 [Bartonella sp. CDC_skunk]|uniref:hypothetical protein n=1 Tax=unclassified Bartonella TaxID=2645622 RepID=UPI0009C2B66C|nr:MULTISPECIES: hypothetical protein [unclassified Bartonella]AQX20866.1 hypothetical protein Bcsk_002030 [Bartonella sp. CDC_skunk]AQX26122.1 hypothetical protein Bra60_000970 [Bartonella sp. Raccoon60]